MVAGAAALVAAPEALRRGLVADALVRVDVVMTPWKQLDGQRVMKVKVFVGTGVVVGGSADVASWCEKDSESETLVTESE